MDEWRIERLGRAHIRDQFDCGQPSLDNFLRPLVSQYENRNFGRTMSPFATQVSKFFFGYYTIAGGAAAFESVPPEGVKKLPRYALPVVLIARLAVDHTIQGQRIGEMLLLDALARSVELSDQLTIHAVVVEALDQ